MKNKLLYVLWGVLFSICAGLGFMPEASGWTAALSVAFFIPPAVVLYRGDRNSAKLVSALAALSLGLTLVLLIANMWSVAASEAVGTALYYLLVIVSAPMVSSGCWALSLFLWACLLMAGLRSARSAR